MKSLMSLLIVGLYAFQCFGQASPSVKMAPIQVMVMDFDNNSRSGEQLLFEGKQSGKVFKGVSDENGKFEIGLPGGDIYMIKIKSIGEAQDYNTLEIPLLGEGQSYAANQITIKFELPKTFTLDNVHFETGKATITKNSYPELNELVSFMTLKKTVSIEIAGHTDNVGEDAANLKLSQARADAVRNFLTSKGIAASRVIAKGYGENSPADTNNTPEGRQNNRRTEVKILSE